MNVAARQGSSRPCDITTVEHATSDGVVTVSLGKVLGWMRSRRNLPRLRAGRRAGAGVRGSARQPLPQNGAMRPSECLQLHRAQVLALAHAHGATDVRVFGSAARGADRDDSDLDLLVAWPAERSLLDLVGLQLDLQETLGVRVDLATERELHPLLRDRILAQAVAL